MGKEKNANKSIPKGIDPRVNDHLANERTFLSWLRTSTGIMAFGFVVERFTLFSKQVNHILSSMPLINAMHISSSNGFSLLIGEILVFFGVVTCVLSFVQFKSVQGQINSGEYRPSNILNMLMTLSVVLMGAILIFLLHNAS